MAETVEDKVAPIVDPRHRFLGDGTRRVCTLRWIRDDHRYTSGRSEGPSQTFRDDAEQRYLQMKREGMKWEANEMGTLPKLPRLQ